MMSAMKQLLVCANRFVIVFILHTVRRQTTDDDRTGQIN